MLKAHLPAGAGTAAAAGAVQMTCNTACLSALAVALPQQWAACQEASPSQALGGSWALACSLHWSFQRERLVHVECRGEL